MGQLELRDYQEEAIERIFAARARGIRSQVLVAATGLGKTVMFSTLAERMGTRTVVLVHRDELVEQAVAKMREVWPAASVGVVKGPRDEILHRVVVASVQTLARDNRLGKLLRVADGTGLFGDGDPIGLLVIDECHHATAATYRKVIDGVRAKHPDCLVVGVTATPDRADGAGLISVFDEVVADYGILWGISAGYLSDVRALTVHVDYDEADLTTNRGDYDQRRAAEVMTDAGGIDVIARAWHDHAADRLTIAFVPTVAMAENLADRFRRDGISARAVSATTPIDERRRYVEQFRAGEIRVLTNCGVFTEGFDAPETSCIVQARPTKSRGLFTQMVGRGLRRHPGKTDCLVLDVTGTGDVHSLVTVPSLFGVKKRQRQRGLSDGTANLSEVMAGEQTDEVRAGRITAEEANLFTKVRSEGIAWVAIPDPRWPDVTRYVRQLGGKDSDAVVLARVTDEHAHRWVAGVVDAHNRKTVLIGDVSLETAQGVAEDYIRKHATNTALVDANAKWRTRKPSSKMKAACAKWHLPIDPGWNAGQCSDALSAHIAKIQSKKAAKAAAKEAGS